MNNLLQIAELNNSWGFVAAIRMLSLLKTSIYSINVIVYGTQVAEVALVYEHVGFFDGALEQPQFIEDSCKRKVVAIVVLSAGLRLAKTFFLIPPNFDNMCV